MSSESGFSDANAALPSQWPSAWPSLRSNALLGAIIPVVAAVVVVVVLALSSALSHAWWVALVPLLLLIGPLSLPSRVRTVVRDAANARTLDIVQATVGLIATVRHRRLGVRPTAEVVPGQQVRYYLNKGKRAPRSR